MFPFGDDLYGYSGQKVMNTFGFTPSQYLRLGDDIKQMLFHEYWLIMNNQNNKNEMDMINQKYSNEYNVKTKKLSIFKKN